MLMKPRGNLSFRQVLGSVPDRPADVACRSSCGPSEVVAGHLGRTLVLTATIRADAVFIDHPSAKVARVRHRGGSGETSKQVPSTWPPVGVGEAGTQET
ncbi:hypothetical protein [Microvirga makkahensis]|uniref:Uncharacterized protein n=1 Tax=Microvirga makkahensis TaxID=1128670 RepID=A0A7X3SPH7_9HYPH|nr:hypothetical protein [Microvirga makkahensis]MXQ12243.1 hypothetical protein [Microvirga makkahensis]